MTYLKKYRSPFNFCVTIISYAILSTLVFYLIYIQTRLEFCDHINIITAFSWMVTGVDVGQFRHCYTDFGDSEFGCPQ